MTKLQKFLLLNVTIILTSCGDSESWYCRVDGDAMYSISETGRLGSADKGCSCEQIRSFEYNTFGSVDEDALQGDFGC
jgi:hypothetical protein